MSTTVMEPVVATETRSAWQAGASTASLAVLLGLVSGLACVGVRLGFRMLQWVFVQHTGLLPDAAARLGSFHRVLVPVAGALLATAVLSAARRWSRAEAFSEYVEAVRFDEGHIPFASTAWRTASSAFSVASGAAVGREGSMIQFATAVSSWCGSRLGGREVSLPRKVSYGAAAAVAAAYQAPLAGVFFAFEIVLGEWHWTDLVPLLLAAFSGWLTSRALLGGGPFFAIEGNLSMAGLLWTLPLALLLGGLGPAYQGLLRSFAFLKRLPMPLLWGALAVGLLSIVHPAVWGNGDVALLRTLQGAPVVSSVLVILIFRLVATTACVGAGTVGGVFTPTLFVGAALGLLAGSLLHVSQPVLLATVGMSAFLAGVTHAPWMAAFMAAELTGQWHLLPVFLVLNLLAKTVAGRISPRSLYAIATPAPTGAPNQ
jgi:CIC family chloride channel protein